MQSTKSLLDFIISLELQLSEYHTLKVPIREKFSVTKDGIDAVKKLIEVIIYWENNVGNHNSLESVLNNFFFIRNL